MIYLRVLNYTKNLTKRKIKTELHSNRLPNSTGYHCIQY